jgi:hypothetical protein
MCVVGVDNLFGEISFVPNGTRDLLLPRRPTDESVGYFRVSLTGQKCVISYCDEKVLLDRSHRKSVKSNLRERISGRELRPK